MEFFIINQEIAVISSTKTFSFSLCISFMFRNPTSEVICNSYIQDCFILVCQYVNKEFLTSYVERRETSVVDYRSCRVRETSVFIFSSLIRQTSPIVEVTVPNDFRHQASVTGQPSSHHRPLILTFSEPEQVTDGKEGNPNQSIGNYCNPCSVMDSPDLHCQRIGIIAG